MMSSADLPQGAGSVSDALRDAGYSISEAAVGRVLRGMRNGGLLERIGFQGHTITPEGKKQMHKLDARIRVSDILQECLNNAEERGKPHLCDTLVALRALGRETVSGAVKHASDADLARIEAILEENSAREGEQPRVGLFREFYQTLLSVSKIPMFEHFFSLLDISVMSDARLSKVFQEAERSLGGTYHAILDEIKARRTDTAAGMVDSQIDKIILQVMTDEE